MGHCQLQDQKHEVKENRPVVTYTLGHRDFLKSPEGTHEEQVSAISLKNVGQPRFTGLANRSSKEQQTAGEFSFSYGSGPDLTWEAVATTTNTRAVASNAHRNNSLYSVHCAVCGDTGTAVGYLRHTSRPWNSR